MDIFGTVLEDFIGFLESIKFEGYVKVFEREDEPYCRLDMESMDGRKFNCTFSVDGKVEFVFFNDRNAFGLSSRELQKHLNILLKNMGNCGYDVNSIEIMKGDYSEADSLFGEYVYICDSPYLIDYIDTVKGIQVIVKEEGYDVD